MRKKIDPKQFPYLAALAQAVLFSIAGDGYFKAFGWLVGLLVGSVVSLSIASSASRISDIARNRKPLAYVSFYLLMALSPSVIALSLVVPESPFTAIAWAVAPDLSIALTGAVIGKSLTHTEQPAQRKEQPAKIRSAKKSKAERVACRWGCGKSGTQAAMNAHSPHCKKNPAKQLVEMVNAKGGE